MITIEIKRNPTGIEEIIVSGHAKAARHGKDIVCSAVSAIAFGTLNSVHVLLGIIPDVKQADQSGGYLSWRLATDTDEAIGEKQQLLAESMAISMIMIAENYGKYVTVSDTKWQGGATQ
ncbi:ribosomal-processing cysteine protease Prp [Brevibacillus fluminis]|uniref:ribosomal-processing cysteine protease Prp n=1 Tax=Brevibacillus fluminis TaxID=511487 RepID=UPI003F8AA5D2